MKNQYEKPEMEIVEFDRTDIIVTSGAMSGTDEPITLPDDNF